MLKKILLGLVVVIVGVLGFAATRPDDFRIERSLAIGAPADVVFAQLTDFHKWGAWSPWDKLDPAMKKTYGGTENAVGHTYTWEGNKDVGKGKMTIAALDAPKSLTIKLEFQEPMAATNDTIFTVAPKGENGVTVSWAMTGHNNFVSKLFSVFMNIDEMVGKDFEKGLAALKTSSEAAAKAAAEAAAKKKAEEEAAAKAAAEAAAAAAAAAASAPAAGSAAPASAP